MSKPLPNCSIVEISALIKSKSVKVIDVVEQCLTKISNLNDSLNAFIAISANSAREAAIFFDSEIADGKYRGPLHGIPISVKDIINVAGTATTAASHVRTTTPSITDAPLITRLRSAGAIIIGKCNMHEFAFGTTGEDSAFGPTRNPHDLERSPGGSSGGSAVSVATGMAYASIGTDTGGSIRIPAAACGVVGLKPSFGEIPCEGIIPLSPSLDHGGPITRTVTDAWLLYRYLSENLDSYDPSAIPSIRPEVRLGIPRAYFLEHLDTDVRRAFDDTLGRLTTAGCHITDVDITHADLIPATYLHIILPEAYAYHAHTLQECPNKYTKGVRTRLAMGQYILAEDYVRARHGKKVLRHEVDTALTHCDALVLPTLPIPAPQFGRDEVRLGDKVDLVRSAMLRLTQLFNLTGHPVLSIPCGQSSNSLPVGLQLVGVRNRTDELLQLAAALESHIVGNRQTNVVQ